MEIHNLIFIPAVVLMVMSFTAFAGIQLHMMYKYGRQGYIVKELGPTQKRIAGMAVMGVTLGIGLAMLGVSIRECS